MSGARGSRYDAVLDPWEPAAGAACRPTFSFRIMSQNGITLSEIEALRRFDSCTLSNAIETLNVRPRNEGFIQRGVRCVFPKLPPVAGHAVTGRLRSATQPIHGHCYYDHIEWWRYLETIPPPRIVVLRDADDPPGIGALFGSLHARICMALDCVAYITNGTVRDLSEIERLGFQLFARGPAVSHAYAHVVEFGCPVEIGGLKVHIIGGPTSSVVLTVFIVPAAYLLVYRNRPRRVEAQQ